MSLISSGVVALRDGAVRCDVVPQFGGAIAGFWWESATARLDWLRPASAAAIARGAVEAMGCIPLVPYGHRIRNARFRFCGQDVCDASRDGEHRALNGHGWRRTWNVVERAAACVVMEYRHEPDGWPWPYRAWQTVSLADGALTLTLAVENLSDAALMPVGIGFLPAFPVAGGATLAAATGGVWQCDSESLPRELTAVPPEWNFADGRTISGAALDHVFTAWNGHATVAWPRRASSVALAGDWPMLSFLAVAAAPEWDYFRVGPCSHCGDAVNLARLGVADTGIRVLTPGSARQAKLVLAPTSGQGF